MRVEVIEGSPAIAGLRAHWESVYDADPEASYFLSHDWLFGTPQGAGRDGLVLAARDPRAGDEYAAFLPIRLNTEHEDGKFHNELNLCGNFNSDYTGFICRPEAEDAAIPAFAARLGRMRWRRLRLLNFAPSDRRTRLFLQAFSSKVLQLKHLKTVNPDGTDNGICPHATLAADWDTFLATNVSANTRQKIRRFLRQVEGSDAFRFTHTTNETFERDLEILIRLWSERWGENKGKRLAAIQSSVRRMLRNALETGTLFMPMLWHEDRAICALAILVDARKKAYNFYIGARDDDFRGPPAGLVLHAYAMRHAIAEGIVKYDFLRGNEPYKYAFGATEARIRSLLISTKSGRNLGEGLDPRCIGYVRNRVAGFYRNGDLSLAAAGYAQLQETRPDDRSLIYLRGVVAARLGDTSTACEAYRTLIERDPASLKTWIRLGRAVLSEYGTWNEAVAAYSALLGTVPDQRLVAPLLGRVLARLGQVDFAVAVIESAQRRAPEDPTLRLAMAEVRAARAAGVSQPRGGKPGRRPVTGHRDDGRIAGAASARRANSGATPAMDGAR